MQYKKKVVAKTFLFVDGTNLYAGQYETILEVHFVVIPTKPDRARGGISFNKVWVEEIPRLLSE